MSKSLYLASQSPRRLELLRQIGLQPTVLPLRVEASRADVDESPLPMEPALAYVQRVTHLKLSAGLRAQTGRRLPDWPILAADTTVTLDGQILGKPTDATEATAMLRAYSGRTHSVLTAVGIAWHGRLQVVVNESLVTFKPLSEAAIHAYTLTNEPYDKAGGYGIQGRAACFIEHISGSYSGIMGLPLCETCELLQELGFEMT